MCVRVRARACACACVRVRVKFEVSGLVKRVPLQISSKNRTYPLSKHVGTYFPFYLKLHVLYYTMLFINISLISHTLRVRSA